MTPAPESFDGQPHYGDRLRVEFQPLSAAPDASRRAALEDEAAALLGSLLAIEEHAASKSEDDKEAGPDLIRIERKLDLVLELLSMRLLDGSSATEHDTQVSASGARWRLDADAAPAPGTPGIAVLYIHRQLPRPLRLAAVVKTDEPGWLRVEFLPVGEACGELLVRHVFQQHRRKLAGARRSRRD